MDWKKFYQSIPNKVKVGKQPYEVLWIDQFTDDRETLGETRFDTHQIILHTGQTPKQASSTFLHETLHAIAEEYDITLTESQVLALEKGLVNLLSSNNASLRFEKKKT